MLALCNRPGWGGWLEAAGGHKLPPEQKCAFAAGKVNHPPPVVLLSIHYRAHGHLGGGQSLVQSLWPDCWGCWSHTFPPVTLPSWTLGLLWELNSRAEDTHQLGIRSLRCPKPTSVRDDHLSPPHGTWKMTTDPSPCSL